MLEDQDLWTNMKMMKLKLKLQRPEQQMIEKSFTEKEIALVANQHLP